MLFDDFMCPREGFRFLGESLSGRFPFLNGEADLLGIALAGLCRFTILERPDGPAFRILADPLLC